MKARIISLADALGMSARAFSKAIGASDAWASTISNSVGSEFLAKILVAFPEVNCRWLITGEGSMFLEKGAATGDQTSVLRDLVADNRSLRDKLIEEMKNSQQLIIENAQLKVQLEIAKKGVQTDD